MKKTSWGRRGREFTASSAWGNGRPVVGVSQMLQVQDKVVIWSCLHLCVKQDNREK